MADPVQEILGYDTSDNVGMQTVMGIYAGEIQ